MTIVAETSWEGVLEELLLLRGTAILLGTTDCGKSTLARHLLRELTGQGVISALVDADIGQSSLGLPGTVSMKIFRTPADLDPYRFERLSFVGSVNPARIIPQLVEETGRMAVSARQAADITLIDTTGLVAGDLGKALKLGKIRMVKPQLIIAIQRHDELEHILPLIGDIPLPIHLLKPSPLARARSQEARAAYRNRRLADYFTQAPAAEFLITTHEADFIYRNRPLNLRDVHVEEGTVIGLERNGETLALGIVDEIDDTSVTFRSPLSGLKGINRVVIGDITLEGN
jgi:polynucleotide 5'-hydroxyl-kinase GRC3/NOL9